MKTIKSNIGGFDPSEQRETHERDESGGDITAQDSGARIDHDAITRYYEKNTSHGGPLKK